MTTLNDFKSLRAFASVAVQQELYSLFSQDPDVSFQLMVDKVEVGRGQLDRTDKAQSECQFSPI